MTPSHARKGGKRYRYDVTRLSALIQTGAIACRISAPEAERIVIGSRAGRMIAALS